MKGTSSLSSYGEQSQDLQAGGSWVLVESCDCLGAVAHESFDDRGWLVVASQPDALGGVAVKGSHVREVRILSDQDKAVDLGMLPYGTVVGFGQPRAGGLGWSRGSGRREPGRV